MRYIEPVFRPPSEADSYILQVTYGCTHNKCTFCGMYRSKKFKLRPLEEIYEDIQTASRLYPQTEKVFLADGDAMTLSMDRLLPILETLNSSFFGLKRIGIYADAHGIHSKSHEELIQLRKLKLDILYLGLESGSDKILEQINKGSTAEEMTKALLKAQGTGIKTSVIAILGLGGKDLSSEHAVETAKAISEASPDYFSALTLTLVPGTEMFHDSENGKFTLLTPQESLEELAHMLSHINPKRHVIFRTNHASNYVPLKGILPDDKMNLINNIRHALESGALRPEWMRGL